MKDKKMHKMPNGMEMSNKLMKKMMDKKSSKKMPSKKK